VWPFTATLATGCALGSGGAPPTRALMSAFRNSTCAVMYRPYAAGATDFAMPLGFPSLGCLCLPTAPSSVLAGESAALRA
jgi:hypothetical protein